MDVTSSESTASYAAILAREAWEQSSAIVQSGRLALKEPEIWETEKPDENPSKEPTWQHPCAGPKGFHYKDVNDKPEVR